MRQPKSKPTKTIEETPLENTATIDTATIDTATIPMLPVDDVERRQFYSDLLDESRKEQLAIKKAQEIPLAALLGHYEPIEGHGGYFGRSPKLRQQIEIAAMSEEAAKKGDDPSMAGNLLETARMACLALFKCTDEKMVRVEVEDFLDEFNADETVGFLTKYLGMASQQATDADGNKDPNASA